MKLKDGTEVVVLPVDHTYRAAAEDGLPDIDLVEVGSIYHHPLVKPCDLPDESCSYTQHFWEIPACNPDYSSSDAVALRRSIATHVAEPCPKPECFGPFTDIGVRGHA